MSLGFWIFLAILVVAYSDKTSSYRALARKIVSAILWMVVLLTLLVALLFTPR